jgi:hypothetical protein
MELAKPIGSERNFLLMQRDVQIRKIVYNALKIVILFVSESALLKNGFSEPWIPTKKNPQISEIIRMQDLV